jgi:Holliday junction resolvase RusA-like endonuclease
MDEITITLTGTPVGKGRPRFARRTGHVHTPAKTLDYEGNLRLQAQQTMGLRPPLDGPLDVSVVAAFPIPASWSKKRQQAALACTELPTKKPDVDNIIKMLDALNEVAFKDDSQIVRATIFKVYSDRPQLQITIRSLALV